MILLDGCMFLFRQLPIHSVKIIGVIQVENRLVVVIIHVQLKLYTKTKYLSCRICSHIICLIDYFSSVLQLPVDAVKMRSIVNRRWRPTYVHIDLAKFRYGDNPSRNAAITK